jgi:hypothetical protein
MKQKLLNKENKLAFNENQFVCVGLGASIGQMG